VKFGQLVLIKITEIVATRCQILRLKCTKFDFGWGFAPDPTLLVVETVYISIAVRNNVHFVLYHYYCKGRYSVNIHLNVWKSQGKVREFDNDWGVATLTHVYSKREFESVPNASLQNRELVFTIRELEEK